MMSVRRLLIQCRWLCLFIFVNPAGAEVYNMPSQLRDAQSRANEIYGLASELDQMVRDAENKKTPKPHGSRFQDFVKRIDAIAEQIRKHPFPTVDASKYPISVPDIERCETRESAVKIARGYSEALSNAYQNEAKEIQSKFQEALEVNKKTIALVTDLSKKVEALTGNPFLTELNWLWWDLDKVRHALSEVGSALTERSKQFIQERDSAAKLNGTLIYNINQLTSASCSVAGIWDGSWTNVDGRSGSYVLRLTKNGSVYSCEMEYDQNRKWACSSVRVNVRERWIEISRPSTWPPNATHKFWYVLNFASDFRSMTGDQWPEPAFDVDPQLVNTLRKR